MELLDDVIRAIRKMHQPVIGAINGPAIGGGFCLSVATDIRIASDAAYFRAAGVNNGLTSSELGPELPAPPRRGLVPRLRHHAHRARRRRRRGRSHRARVARRRPGGELLDTTYEIAERIIGFSRVGIELTKRLLWASLDAGSLHGHMDHEGTTQLYVRLTTENFEEAVGPGGARSRAAANSPRRALSGQEVQQQPVHASGASSCIQCPGPSMRS